MEVYVLLDLDKLDHAMRSCIIGVYKTRELAQEHVDEYLGGPENNDWYKIKKFTVQGTEEEEE